MEVLRTAADVDAPNWWIGAVIRDLVWDPRYGSGFDPRRVKDVDLAFFDSDNLDPQRDRDIEATLVARLRLAPCRLQCPRGSEPDCRMSTLTIGRNESQEEER